MRRRHGRHAHLAVALRAIDGRHPRFREQPAPFGVDEDHHLRRPACRSASRACAWRCARARPRRRSCSLSALRDRLLPAASRLQHSSQIPQEIQLGCERKIALLGGDGFFVELRFERRRGAGWQRFSPAPPRCAFRATRDPSQGPGRATARARCAPRPKCSARSTASGSIVILAPGMYTVDRRVAASRSSR